MRKLKKIALGFGISILAFFVIVFGIAIATYSPDSVEKTEMQPVSKEDITDENFEKWKQDEIAGLVKEWEEKRPTMKEEQKSSPEYIPDFKPHQEIKTLEGKYNCEFVSNGIKQGFKPNEEELLFWLNFCLPQMFSEKRVVGEPVLLTDLSASFPGISYCKSLENTIKNNDYVFRDEIADWVLWCVNPRDP